MRRSSVPDPEGLDALIEARVAADLVKDHREQAARYAAQRARAVMRANQHGVLPRHRGRPRGIHRAWSSSG